ncbi:MAG: hypothetical protein KKF27_09805, partial [Gammaproteobacteria bacterium]|nr:hypothetical protein [Gammaproteobacteria bacterium]
NTLAVQLTLPLAGCAEDLHLQVTSLTTTVNLVALTRNAPCLAHAKKSCYPTDNSFFQRTNSKA